MMTIPYVSEGTVARGIHRNVIGGDVAIPASGSTSVTPLMSNVPRLTVLPVSYVLKRTVVHLDSRPGSPVTLAYCAKYPFSSSLARLGISVKLYTPLALVVVLWIGMEPIPGEIG